MPVRLRNFCEVLKVEFEAGTAEHRRGLARFFIDTYIDYEPEKIRWPALGEAELKRLVGLPFWQEAVATESRTSGKVMAAAQLEADAELRKAIELQGFEENPACAVVGRAHPALSHPHSDTAAPCAAIAGKRVSARRIRRMFRFLLCIRAD